MDGSPEALKHWLLPRRPLSLPGKFVLVQSKDCGASPEVSSKVRKATAQQRRQRTSKSGKSKQPKKSESTLEQPLVDNRFLTD
jgi:hypothetical protein